MKVLFACNDSLIISPSFATYFNYLCETNALKVRIDFCGTDFTDDTVLDEGLQPLLLEKIGKKTISLRDFTAKKMTPEIIENANLIFVSNDDVKDKVLKTKATSKELIFPMTRRKRKLEIFPISNDKKMQDLLSIIEAEMFFFTEKLLRHQYII